MSGWRGDARFRTDDRVSTRIETGEPYFVRSWVSVDPGQANDFTAILTGETYAAAERTYQHDTQTVFIGETHIRHLDRTIYSFRIISAHRCTLGTSYPIVCEQIRSIVAEVQDCDLIVDHTGVGRGVVDILRGKGLRPFSITITHGQQWTQKNREINCAKLELIGCLVTAAQEGRLQFAADIPLRDVIAEEIAKLTARRTATNELTFEASGGVHDDLVMSLACGVWQQTNRRRDATVEPLRL